MITTTRKPRNVKPVSGTCRLTLTVNGTDYRVSPLAPHPEVASLAFRLKKADGTAYDVALTEHGAQCDCPDWIFSRDGKDRKGCKHLAALRVVGLIPRVSPLPTLPPLPPLPVPQPIRPAARSTGDLARNDPEAYDRLQEDWADYPESPRMTDEDIDQMAASFGQD